MGRIPSALQMFSLRAEQRSDFAGAVAVAAEIGYAGVELFGYGNLDAAGAHAAIVRAGLAVAGMHVPFPRLRDEAGEVIAEARLLGARHVVCPHWPAEDYASAAACTRVGERLGAIGAELRAAGLQLGFHHHAAEMRLVEGRTVLDWILGAAAPCNLALELDVFWAQIGGQPPAALLDQHGARCPLVHLRDGAELGRGPVDFAGVLAAIDGKGCAEWLVVEQEDYTLPPREAVRANFEQLRRWGRV